MTLTRSFVCLTLFRSIAPAINAVIAAGAIVPIVAISLAASTGNGIAGQRDPQTDLDETRPPASPTAHEAQPAGELTADGEEGAAGAAAPDLTHEMGQAGADDEHGAHSGNGGNGERGDHGGELGAALPLWSVIPFVGILLSIAIFPLVAGHFWHEHYPKVSLFWAVVLAVPFLLAYHGQAFYAIAHIYLIDYIPFIILLWGLFTVSGGIVVRGSLRGTPAMNTLLLFVGTAMASWVGTTGAAMVMIRPVLRANAHRRSKMHIIIFFIFLVANIGGSLTPLGDPPLFLGFLHSVPFFWTLEHMPAPMFVAAALLLALFYLLDRWIAARENSDELPAEPTEKIRFGIAGAHNFLFLAGIVGAVLMSGLWRPGHYTLLGVHVEIQNTVRDGLIVMCGLLSLLTTRHELRRENDFTWGPIREVAYLFAGIFMTIIPALEILKAGEQGALAGLVRVCNQPWQYYWITGSLSAFLDNAPTYLTFFNTALGKFYPGMAEPTAVAELIASNNVYLLAISAGAVFFGAFTYIGNAPNFMVKSIAEEAGIPMPSFFGYMFRWSVPILLPAFLLVTFIFFV